MRERWREIALGDVLVGIEGGRSPRAEDRLPQAGERAVLKVSAVRPGLFDPSQVKTLPRDVEMPARALVRHGDILMTRANTAELVGAVCQVRGHFDQIFLCDKTLRLLVDERAVLPQFLVHAMAAPQVRHQLATVATGTSGSMKNVSQDKIRGLRLLLPPIDEQRRIADVLSHVDELRSRMHARVEVVKALLDARREALMAPSGDWANLPEDWSLRRLDDIVELKLGFTKGRKLMGPTTELPYLRAANVHNGDLRLGDVRTEVVLVAEAEKWALQPDDLLFIEGGNPEDLGRGWIWEGQIAPCLHQNSVFRGRVRDTSQVLPRFLAYAITCFPARRYCESSSIQTSNIAHIGTARMSAMPVAVPPYEEQVQIAEELNAVRAAWEASRAEVSALAQLRAALIDELMDGRCVVPPSYDRFLADENSAGVPLEPATV